MESKVKKLILDSFSKKLMLRSSNNCIDILWEFYLTKAKEEVSEFGGVKLTIEVYKLNHRKSTLSFEIDKGLWDLAEMCLNEVEKELNEKPFKQLGII